jgi:Zn-dependent protease
LPAILIALSIHEFAHAFVAYKMGDITQKERGRLSLNPLAHIDITGLLCLMLFQFGWAKPVQVDPRYYKNPKWGMALVALGGPLANFVIAFLSGLILTLIEFYVPYSDFSMILYNFFLYLIIINVGLGLFNLIPIPPLDGSKIIGAILPENSYHQYMKYQKYGMFFIIGLLILLDVLEMMGYPSILNEALNVIVNFILNFWMKIFI